jgi:hypothetical protein
VVVPVPVQHQIAQKAPLVAYVPARLAIGWHYSRWSAGDFGALHIVFKNQAGREIVFVAARFKGNCRAGMTKSFQLAGNKVYWAQAAGVQQAWRCVNGLKLVASTSLPPDRFADVGLGRIASSGHRIRS